MNPFWKNPLFVAGSVLVLLLLGGTSYLAYQQLTPKPVPGSCKILEEKYCKQVAFITPSDLNRLNKTTNMVYAAYQLPKGTPIFVPFGIDAMTRTGSDDSTFNKMTEKVPFVFMQHTLSIANNVQSTRAYVFSFNFKTNQISKKFPKEGDILTRVDGTNVGENTYTLLVQVQQIYTPTVHPSTFKSNTINITKDQLKP